jgi:chaperonin cofactor prefoldin
MTLSADIKNLSIALEALSRIQADYVNYSQVSNLLDKTIKKATEELETQNSQTQQTQTKPNDEIPF